MFNSITACYDYIEVATRFKDMGSTCAYLIPDPISILTLYYNIEELLQVTYSHHEETYLGDKPWSDVQSTLQVHWSCLPQVLCM